MAEDIDPVPMATVRAFVDAFNNDDVAGVEAACADETLIIDDFPPYHWTGSRSATKWCDDMGRMAKRYGMSEPSVALQNPRHVIVSDQRAYVVVPIDVRWLEDGMPAERTGFMTMALSEGAEGWRIATLAWTWN